MSTLPKYVQVLEDFRLNLAKDKLKAKETKSLYKEDLKREFITAAATTKLPVKPKEIQIAAFRWKVKLNLDDWYDLLGCVSGYRIKKF